MEAKKKRGIGQCGFRLMASSTYCFVSVVLYDDFYTMGNTQNCPKIFARKLLEVMDLRTSPEPFCSLFWSKIPLGLSHQFETRFRSKINEVEYCNMIKSGLTQLGTF